jgi:cbb3-type cytochrome oxidase subunit 3
MDINLGTVLSGIFSILGAVFVYLLNKKDSTQESDIQILYEKHDEDSNRLRDLELKVAQNHYQKMEVDAILDRFKSYLDDRFDRLEKSILNKI